MDRRPGPCHKAGIPEGTAFATKTELARAMLARAFEAGVPAAWVTGDEVYGSDGDLRRWLKTQGRSYVLAVRENQYVWRGFRQFKVRDLVATLPKRAWHKITIAWGCKGPRRYAWAWLAINHDLGPTWQRWLLVRRSLDGTEELAYYLAAGPKRTTLTRLAQTAGARWSIESGFESAKQEVGLADYEVRSWTGWHRHITPALLAHAILAAVRKVAEEVPKKVGRWPGADRPDGAGSASTAGEAALGPTSNYRIDAGLVGVATGSSGIRATVSLQDA